MCPSRPLSRWAALLDRTLVLPHLLGRGSGGGGSGGLARAAFGRAYDLDRARAGVSRVELIEVDRFAQLGIVPERLLQLRTRAASGGGSGGGGGGGGEGYLRSTLPLLPAAAALDVPLDSFSSDGIRGAFGGCGAHRVIGNTSLLQRYRPHPYPYPYPYP